MVLFKSFEPKEGYEDLALEVNTDRVVTVDEAGNAVLDSNGYPVYDRPDGAPLSITEWPFTARSDQEQKHLEAHPFIQEAKPEVDATTTARELAQQNNVDLNDVSGTGEGGRVLKEDVEKFIANREAG